jgi:hypothetical protein
MDGLLWYQRACKLLSLLPQGSDWAHITTGVGGTEHPMSSSEVVVGKPHDLPENQGLYSCTALGGSQDSST